MEVKEDLFKQFSEEAKEDLLNGAYSVIEELFDNIKRDGVNRKKRIKYDKDIFIRLYKIDMAISAIVLYCKAREIDYSRFKELDFEIQEYMRPYYNVMIPYWEKK